MVIKAKMLISVKRYDGLDLKRYRLFILLNVVRVKSDLITMKLIIIGNCILFKSLNDQTFK